MLWNLLFDPKIFNYVILTLYFLNIVNWGWRGGWTEASYWFGAFWITATVTYKYQ